MALSKTKSVKLDDNQKAIFKRLLEVAHHGKHCRCRNVDCIGLRRSIKKWDKKLQPMRDAAIASTQLTAADYAVTINVRD